MRLALGAARGVGARTVLGERGLEVYEAAANDPRCRDLDARVVYRWLGGDEEWEAKGKGKGEGGAGTGGEAEKDDLA